MRLHIVCTIAALLVLSTAGARAQSSPDIHAYVAQVTAGNVEEAKRDLPSLLAKYPDDPGVLYLQALLETDGGNAARIYQSIVDNDPKSEWADAALYKVYQFYYALGLYKTADLKMAQLQKDYPHSKYLKERGRRTVATAAPAVPKHDSVAVNTAAAPESARAVPVPSRQVPATPGTSKQQAVEAFALQIGAFTSEANAEKLQRTIQGMGYRVEIVPRVRLDKTMYLVWVGNYATDAAARVGAAELRDKHAIDAMVVSR
jgi:cell division septation protein DedD